MSNLIKTRNKKWLLLFYFPLFTFIHITSLRF
jgi:hypothetical protein